MTTKLRSKAAQERVADQHMALSTRLISISLYGTFAALLGLAVAAFAGPGTGVSSVIATLSIIGNGPIYGLAILVLAPLVLAGYTRKIALDIYDRVSIYERLKRL